jgi:hypothetical protein
MNRLFVSFWTISLDNLPEGIFRRRQMIPEAAKLCIEEARAVDALLGLTDADLLAPYGKDKRDRHEELCGVLRTEFGIDLSLRDFCSAETDADGDLYFINPLSCAKITEDSPLMVVTCCYSLPTFELESEEKLVFAIEPASVEFHIIESV